MLPSGWALVILVLCLMPTENLSGESWLGRINNIDKVVHGWLFFILFLSLFVARQKFSSRISAGTLVMILSICIGYGLLIEILQYSLTSYRSAEFLDVAADGIGATFAAILTLVVKRFI